jgi:hypothetical protein
MSNSELIRKFNAELKENLILKQKYYHNTLPNIDHLVEIFFLLQVWYVTIRVFIVQ